jgi:hypothetical protein
MGSKSSSSTRACLLAAIVLSGGATSARANDIYVGANGDLQAALNAAQPGDTLLLQPGATYMGSF